MIRSALRAVAPGLAVALPLALSAPASAADVSVIGPLAREMSLAPGAEQRGEIEVRNNTDHAEDVLVYAQDYRFQAGGATDFLPPGTLPRSNAAWIGFGPQQVHLPPGESATVAYDVRVPADATLAGTYWSTLVVEPMGDTYAPAAPSGAGVSIHTVVRYAVQLVTDVGDATTDLRIVDRKLLAADGRARLQLDVADTGETRLRPAVWAEVYDGSGALVGRFTADPQRLYPGCSARFALDLGALARGRYTALVVADNGDDHVFGSQYTLDLP